MSKMNRRGNRRRRNRVEKRKEKEGERNKEGKKESAGGITKGPASSLAVWVNGTHVEKG